MRICIQKSTGKMIEWQALATPGTLIQNAINGGFDPADIDERESTIEELELFTPKPEPQPDRLQVVIDELAAKPDASDAIKELSSGSIASKRVI